MAEKIARLHKLQVLYFFSSSGKGWVKPKRDYRDFPIFLEADLKKLKKWKDTLKVT